MIMNTTMNNTSAVRSVRVETAEKVAALLAELRNASAKYVEFSEEKAKKAEATANGELYKGNSEVKVSAIYLLDASSTVPANQENLLILLGELGVIIESQFGGNTELFADFVHTTIHVSMSAAIPASLKAKDKLVKAGTFEKIITTAANGTQDYLKSKE
jgi:hypothetical protein